MPYHCSDYGATPEASDSLFANIVLAAGELLLLAQC